MKAYQADIAKFEAAGAKVVGISVDTPPSNKKFADENGVTFPLLSDMSHKVTKDYGILNESSMAARRTTFVVDGDGLIQHVEQSNSAVDPAAAHAVCARIQKK